MKPTPFTRRARLGLVILGALCAALLIAAAPASAAQVTPAGSFTCDATTPCGSITSGFKPERLATNEQTGDVYVIDEGNDAIVRFNSAGVYQSTIAGSSTTGGTFSFGAAGYEEDTIAIDNSGGANQGRIYVSTFGASPGFGGPGGAFAFAADGSFLWQADPGGGSELACGIGVDPSGVPYETDFSAGMWALDPATGARTGGSAYFTPTGETCAFAFDSSSDVYVREFNTGHLDKFSSSGSSLGTIDSGTNLDVAVDAANQEVFTVHSGEILTYAANGSATTPPSFGSGEITSARGVAVDPADYRVYVADPGAGKVLAYALPEPKALHIALGGNGNGSVECKTTGSFGACAATYEEGTTVTLKGKANAGNVLAGWLGACEPISATECEITLSQNERVTAVFLTEGVVGAPGSNGTNGTDGTNGKDGATGPQGPEGMQGAQGPQGPAGKVTVTCKVKQKGHKVKVTCTVKQSASASRVHWRLSRHGRTFRRGAGAHGRLRLGALPSGRYRLHVEGQKGSTLIVVG